jgi:hypothetical protein
MYVSRDDLVNVIGDRFARRAIVGEAGVGAGIAVADVEADDGVRITDEVLDMADPSLQHGVRPHQKP